MLSPPPARLYSIRNNFEAFISLPGNKISSGGRIRSAVAFPYSRRYNTLRLGRLAQWKSASFTRKRSQVRTPCRPPVYVRGSRDSSGDLFFCMSPVCFDALHSFLRVKKYQKNKRRLPEAFALFHHCASSFRLRSISMPSEPSR